MMASDDPSEPSVISGASPSGLPDAWAQISIGGVYRQDIFDRRLRCGFVRGTKHKAATRAPQIVGPPHLRPHLHQRPAHQQLLHVDAAAQADVLPVPPLHRFQIHVTRRGLHHIERVDPRVDHERQDLMYD